MNTGPCYWRFKGEKPYRYGYATHISGDLWRMGSYNGDTTGGYIVALFDIETRPV